MTARSRNDALDWHDDLTRLARQRAQGHLSGVSRWRGQPCPHRDHTVCAAAAWRELGDGMTAEQRRRANDDWRQRLVFVAAFTAACEETEAKG